MLQQTQVKTVLPYYRRWVKRFPNLRTLSRASLSQVLKLWEGLGYYSRARNLHQAAKLIVSKLDGKFPDSCEALRELPGVGRYTAGAIASIAFGKPEPILDGNVKRVLSRLFALKKPVDTARGEKNLWEIATRLVQGVPSHCGDFNQSLMELGALVCLPENPKCSICPVSSLCKAHRLRKERAFPIRSRREKMKQLKTLAAVIWKDGKVLLQKQPFHARWGGLWTFPHWVQTNGHHDVSFLEEKIRQDLGIQMRGLRPKAALKYGFTKYKVSLQVYEGEALSKGDWPFWIEPKRLRQRPLPKPHQRILKIVQSKVQ